MNFQDFSNICLAGFEKNTLATPTHEQIEKLFQLTEIMFNTNKTMNLTAIRDEIGVIYKHYIDSLLFVGKIPTGSSVLDVGCGAGFPTFPLAIFRPDLEITALDSTVKRIEYVKNTADELHLDNIHPIAARAEESAHDPRYREYFDVVTARAVASLPVLSELCLPFVRPRGRFLAMKAKQANEEVAISTGAIRCCGGKLEDIETLPLHLFDEEIESRTLVTISKATVTPQNYPRHFSKISKKPL